ncbi:hypothetical protein FB563_5935 [Streptomyces puniciscabiei]|uniref:Uncharacterized protein n=1 Tax=Streptomyces puniciscabiei TaxID=164348 RepID=A0A542UP75_9ACTN|nr:hypothetical protein FB563_5935 [Streptomyces puniciscabiei]
MGGGFVVTAGVDLRRVSRTGCRVSDEPSLALIHRVTVGPWPENWRATACCTAPLAAAIGARLIGVHVRNPTSLKEPDPPWLDGQRRLLAELRGRYANSRARKWLGRSSASYAPNRRASSSWVPAALRERTARHAPARPSRTAPPLPATRRHRKDASLPARGHQDPDQVRTDSARHSTFPLFVAGQKRDQACTTSRRRTSFVATRPRNLDSSRVLEVGAELGIPHQSPFTSTSSRAAHLSQLPDS